MEDNAFNGLIGLQFLNLSHNSLTTLPDGIFQPLTSLQTLWVDDAMELLVAYYNELFVFFRDLSHNSISELNPAAFTGLTNLTKL